MSEHLNRVQRLQEAFRTPGPLALNATFSHNTTRSKAYKNSCKKLNFNNLNNILSIDPIKKIAHVEPKVTMEELVAATLKVGLMPPVVPEFKGITVGGAIMGCAGESSSWRYGLFHDACLSYELLLGDGSLVAVSSTENPELFYAIPGSYGSLGALTATQIQLIPAKKTVALTYDFCTPEEIVERLAKADGDFVDGLVLDKKRAVAISGIFSEESASSLNHRWFAFHFKEALPIEEYLFRYDQGAFWMGGYLLKPQILIRFLLEGVLKIKRGSSLKKFSSLTPPSSFWQKLLHRFLDSQTLWKIHHKAENWIQKRFMIQDFCLPEEHAKVFLKEVMERGDLYPLWLCPIQGAAVEQPFAPHSGHKALINIGVYGIPSQMDVEVLTKQLEQKTKELKGRKVLYSTSYYTLEEFWTLYPKDRYQKLREETKASNRWKELTEKVLST